MREVLGWATLLVVAGILNAAATAAFFTGLPALEGSGVSLILALVAVGARCSVARSSIAGLICALFPTPIRQSGFVFPYNLGTAIFSGLAPIAVAWLVRDNGLSVPIIQEALAGAVAIGLAVWVRSMPLYLGHGALDGLSSRFRPVTSAGRLPT